jgi:hypothetical protein
MTKEQTIEELKTWDDSVWKSFKEQNYETINVEFDLHAPESKKPEGVRIGKWMFKSL